MKAFLRNLLWMGVIGILFSMRSDDDTVNGSLVKWMTFEEAVEKSKVEKKKIFIDVYTDWCGYCKVMDKNTFNDPKVAELLNNNFYPVKFNAEQKEDITFRGHTFKYISGGGRGYHELAASLLSNQLSYPTTVFMDEEFRILQVQKGYVPAKDYHKVVKFFGDEYYKKSQGLFEKEYKSPYN